MATVRIIPCLDVRTAAWSRASSSRTCATPATPPSQAAAYAAQGADELVLLDVSATLEDRGARRTPSARCAAAWTSR